MKQAAVNSYWGKKDQERNQNMDGQPPPKKQRIDEEDEEKKIELPPTESNTDSNTNNDSNDSSTINSNSNSNAKPQPRQSSPKQFRFNEKYRLALLKECIDANIMSLGVVFRGVKFGEKWNELIRDDPVWSLATLQRVKDEFYNEH